MLIQYHNSGIAIYTVPFRNKETGEIVQALTNEAIECTNSREDTAYKQVVYFLPMRSIFLVRDRHEFYKMYKRIKEE